ncbi:MAG: hypothetical protein IJX12_00080, partial [Lachnospiraceae bacterium]|nr:hypothetical protein [Lachnospiraceae bacterium]
TSVTYMKSDDVTAFIIAVSGMEGLTEAAVVSQFDSQIATVFGDQCTSSEVTYNGYTATEWDTNAPDGSYKGRSMVIADADADKLIYIEYVTYSGTLDAYYEFAKSFSY